MNLTRLVFSVVLLLISTVEGETPLMRGGRRPRPRIRVPGHFRRAHLKSMTDTATFFKMLGNANTVFEFGRNVGKVAVPLITIALMAR